VIVRQRVFYLLLLVLLGGCAGGLNLPAKHRPQSYTVQRGDTLYSIAWHYGLDFHRVAQWNGIRPPYRIYPGQRVYLYPGHKRAASSPSRKKSSPTVAKRPSKPKHSKPQRSGHRSGSTHAASSKINWQWPAQGHVSSRFGEPGIAGKGVVIQGSLGEPIVASASGTVVYVGSALVGYGRLIIIKHNDEWLSAYGHNQRLLAHEGDSVKAGQKIATMGRASDGTPALYFEIRENGTPVDPLRFLSSKR
jgi:lipoprotein NlpD